MNENYDGVIIHLWDEFQQFFQLSRDEMDKAAIHPYFKEIVTTFNRQLFVITGSGMATAWNAYSKIPTNGYTIYEGTIPIYIPDTMSKSLLKKTAEIMETIYPEYFQINGFSIEDIRVHMPFTNVALFVYAVRRMNAHFPKIPIPQLIEEEIDKKYLSEFMIDVLPVFEKEPIEIRKIVHQLVQGILVSLPPGWLGAFFGPFVI